MPIQNKPKRSPKPISVSWDHNKDLITISNFSINDLARFNNTLNKTIEAVDPKLLPPMEMLKFFLIKSVADKGYHRYLHNAKSVVITVPESIAFYLQFQHEMYLGTIVHNITGLLDQQYR